jgi:hypothetical protein
MMSDYVPTNREGEFEGPPAEGATPGRPDRLPTNQSWLALGILTSLIACGAVFWLALGLAGSGVLSGFGAWTWAVLPVAVVVLFVVLRLVAGKRKNAKMLSFARGGLWTAVVVVGLFLLLFGSCLVIIGGLGN